MRVSTRAFEFFPWRRPPEKSYLGKSGLSAQRQWAWLITFAFFFGEVGAGLFVMSSLVQFRWGMLAGLIVAVLAKGYPHLIFLGHPLRFWRALLRPQTSWVSRGFIAMGVFTVFGALYFLMVMGWLGGRGTSLEWVVGGIALGCAFVLMIYDGMMMSFSPALPAWNTPLLPTLCLTFSLMAGSTLVFAVAEYLGLPMAVEVGLVGLAEKVIIVFNLLLVLIYVYVTGRFTEASRESVLQLTGRYRWPFWGGVLLVGLMATLSLSLLSEAMGRELLIAAAMTELIGDFLILFLILRVGVYQPLLTGVRGAKRISK